MDVFIKAVVAFICVYISARLYVHAYVNAFVSVAMYEKGD